MATAQEIAAALAASSGASSIRFRFEQRSIANGLMADLTKAVTSATITMNNDRAINRAATFEIDATQLPATFTAPGSFIAVWMDVMISGSYEPIQIGLFRADRPKRTYTPEGGQTWSLEASDLAAVLMDSKITATYTVPATSNYIDAVRGLLNDVGLSHNFGNTVDLTPIAFSWPPRTPRYTIASNLLAGINWFSPWPDATGVFTSRERADPATLAADVIFYTEQEPRMVRVPYAVVEDYTRGPNRYTVATQDPARATVAATRENRYPPSPISTVTLGTELFDQATVDWIVSAATASNYADYMLRDAVARSRVATLQSWLDPRRGPHEIYQLFVSGVEFGSLWRADSWRFTCTTGAKMEHSIGQVQTITLVTP
jgi:hypothetical protein